MRIRQQSVPRLTMKPAGFTLVDALFGMGIAGIMFISLYAGLATGFQTIRLARENTRATQIMVEKMETIRLYTWDQINSNGFIPEAFVQSYFPLGGATNSGPTYTGRLSIAECPLATSYAPDMKMVTVKLDWVSGGLARTRKMSTYVARYGLQNYVY